MPKRRLPPSAETAFENVLLKATNELDAALKYFTGGLAAFDAADDIVELIDDSPESFVRKGELNIAAVRFERVAALLRAAASKLE